MFSQKQKIQKLYSSRNESLLGKRESMNDFWNYDDNNLGNDLLRDILHHNKHFKDSFNGTSLQFRNTAEYLKSNFD